MLSNFIPSFREVLQEGTFCEIFPILLPFDDVYPSLLVYLQLIAEGKILIHSSAMSDYNCGSEDALLLLQEAKKSFAFM